MRTSRREYVGLTEAAARRRAAANGEPVRVIQFAAELNLNAPLPSLQLLQLVVDDGVVVDAYDV